MLGINQQRYAAAVFAEVEHHLLNAERVLSSAPTQFSSQVDDMTPTDKQDLLRMLGQLRDALYETGRKLGLPEAAISVSARWRVRTGLEFALVELHELSASRLRGYGDLNTETLAALNTQIEALQTRIHELLESL